jgi:HlyD family secretion protein
MRCIFRQQALEHASSPEQLTQLMRVVSPKHWLALATCAALLGVTLLWGIYGRLPTTVMGRGVLIRPRKVTDLQAPAVGRLATLTVRVGDAVRAGDVLGTIAQVEILQQLQEARVREEALLTQDRVKHALQGQHTALQEQQNALAIGALALQRHDVHKRLSDAQAKAPVLQQRFENRQRLEALGLIPRLADERLQAEQAYLDNQHTIAALQAELKQLDSKEKQLATQSKRQALDTLEALTARKNQIQELQSHIALLEVQLAKDSEIRSQYTGRILELTVHVGQLLQTGLRLGSVEVEDATSMLVGVHYFPIKAGKKIQPGMTIHVTPDTVARERFGSLLGTITAVSAFPVTKDGIANLVGNAEVVTALAAQGPVIEVTAELLRDATTANGYRWSSSAGPALPMTSGTTTTGRVVLEQRAPMTYLLPILREVSGRY